jgi:two-component system sensor histidine kinase ChiS
MGDAVMALFPHAAEDALNAAIGMQEKLVAYNEGRKRAGYKPISIGTALHTGSLMLGIIGGKGTTPDGQSNERLEATVISDAVNLASRLEGMTKIYSCRILASEETLNAVPSRERFNYRFLIKAQVKGKSEPVSVYEIFDGDPPELRDLKLKTKPDFEAGLALYLDRSFTEAAVQFKNVLEANPDDKAARLYLERAAHFMVNDVAPDWRGIETLTEK